MPTLPTYDSQRNITSQSVAPVRNEAKERAEVGAPLIEASAEIQQKWNNTVDMVQETTARANYETELNEVINKANNDPEYNNSAAYKQEIEKIKEKNLKGFQNKMIEQKVALDFDLGNRLANLKIDNIYNKKLIDVGRVSAFRLIDLEKSRYINAADEQQKNSSAVAMKSIIDEQVKAGLFSQEEGYKLYEKSIKEAQEVIKDNNGLRAKQEKEITLAKEFAKNQREDELVKMRIDGMLTPEVIRSDLNNGLIDPKFAEAALNSLKSPKTVNAVSKDNTYLEFQNRVMDIQAKGNKATLEETGQLIADVMQAHAEGLLDKDDTQRILKERNIVLQKKIGQLASETVDKNNPKSFLQTISFWSDENAVKKEEAKARMYRSFMDKLRGGVEAKTALDEVIREEQINNNPNRAKYNIGDIITNSKTGKSYKVTGYDADGEPLVDEVK